MSRVANEIIGLATSRGVRVPVAELQARLGGAAQFRRMLKALTVVEDPIPGRPAFIPGKKAEAFFHETVAGQRVVYLPRVRAAVLLRAGALTRITAAADLPRPRAEPIPGKSAAGVPLYSYQEATVRFAVERHFTAARAAAHTASLYLKIDTGLGKTRIAGGIIAELGIPAAVIVPTIGIGKQWEDELAEAFPGLRVGTYANQTKSRPAAPPTPATHDVVIFIINTFRGKGPEVLDGYGLVVLDEAHEYHSPSNRKALWLAQTRFVLGLSATPEQKSARGLDRYVFFHLGEPVEAKTAVPGFDLTDATFTGRVRKIEYAGHPDHVERATTAAGTVSAVGTIANLVGRADGAVDDPGSAGDPHRLRLVVAEIERLLHAPLGPHPTTGAPRRHGIFVFAEFREFLPKLRAALVARVDAAEVIAPELDDLLEKGQRKEDEKEDEEVDEKEKDNDEKKLAQPISILRGAPSKIAKDALQRARAAGAHVVLTTYGYSRRGISLQTMTALVLATPRRNGGEQILGRILRRGSDQTIVREVVDIVDTRSGLKSQFTDRNKSYAAKGWPVSVVKTSWEQYPVAGPITADEKETEAEDEDDAQAAAATLDDLL